MHAEWKELITWADAEVRATWKALPAALRARVEALPVTYEHRPTPAMVADAIAPDTLGLFIGDAFADNEPGQGELPAQIILFLDNLWDFAEGHPRVFRREIRTTLLHEIGHYLGLDEGDLGERGLE